MSTPRAGSASPEPIDDPAAWTAKPCGATRAWRPCDGPPIASPLATALFVTVHPSAVLRAPDTRAREAGFASLVTDLCLALAHASGG